MFFQVSGVESFRSGTTFVLCDGSEVEADAILFCTGYSFEFPFLDLSCNVRAVNQQVIQSKILFLHLCRPFNVLRLIAFNLRYLDLGTCFWTTQISGNIFFFSYGFQISLEFNAIFNISFQYLFVSK
jgi:hypothetical protein